MIINEIRKIIPLLFMQAFAHYPPLPVSLPSIATFGHPEETTQLP